MLEVVPVPDRLYVVGDIHGRADLLEQMIAKITRDLDPALAKGCLTVTLGDYVDRGPESRMVVDRLADNPFPTAFIALKGNHEVLLERFLSDPSTVQLWRNLGGLETLHSYGVDVSRVMRGTGYEEAAAALRDRLPRKHLEFLQRLGTSLSAGGYFLCHAGVRPGIPLAQQSEDDLLWVRDDFLDSRDDFGKVVVHGHTPVEAPDIRINRINIDTGAFMTGRLTCAVLDGDRLRVLTAS